MKGLLEKRKQWFWLYIISEILGFVCSAILALVVVGSIWQEHLTVPTVITVMLLITSVYTDIYYLYRLLYLYKGTSDRTKWTVFNLIFIVGNWIGGDIPILGSILSIVCLILGIMCIVHDYSLIFDSH